MNKLNSILLSVLLLAALGLIAGLGLAVASELMAVPVDETSENIRECLPGANCGACGFSGCDGYAAALSNGETKNTAL
ncbi:MAG: (Fe-S)-binding protein, partial [Oscillospiraceae bacterium]